MIDNDLILERVPILQPTDEAHCNGFLVQPEQLVAAIDILRTDATLNFDALLDLTVVEYPEGMAGVYTLARIEDLYEIRLTVPFSKENLHLPTISDQYSAANLMESEAYDFFGVIYDGHQNLHRVLCADDFVGFPLRKDYISHTRD